MIGNVIKEKLNTQYYDYKIPADATTSADNIRFMRIISIDLADIKETTDTIIKFSSVIFKIMAEDGSGFRCNVSLKKVNGTVSGSSKYEPININGEFNLDKYLPVLGFNTDFTKAYIYMKYILPTDLYFTLESITSDLKINYSFATVTEAADITADIGDTGLISSDIIIYPKADTATLANKLSTARTINGVSFNGSSNIVIPTVQIVRW